METTRLAGGGYTFEMHVDQVGVDPAWTDALTGSTAWRYGILQEQSQTHSSMTGWRPAEPVHFC